MLDILVLIETGKKIYSDEEIKKLSKMFSEWVNLVGHQTHRKNCLEKAQLVLKINFPKKGVNGEDHTRGKRRIPFSKIISQKKYKLTKVKKLNIHERMQQAINCFEKMKDEAVIKERVYEKKLERHLSIQIREKIGYKEKSDIVKKGFLSTTSKYTEKLNNFKALTVYRFLLVIERH